jgi:hypothetical protein
MDRPTRPTTPLSVRLRALDLLGAHLDLTRGERLQALGTHHADGGQHVFEAQGNLWRVDLVVRSVGPMVAPPYHGPCTCASGTACGRPGHEELDTR